MVRSLRASHREHGKLTARCSAGRQAPHPTGARAAPSQVHWNGTSGHDELGMEDQHFPRHVLEHRWPSAASCLHCPGAERACSQGAGSADSGKSHSDVVYSENGWANDGFAEDATTKRPAAAEGGGGSAGSSAARGRGVRRDDARGYQKQARDGAPKITEAQTVEYTQAMEDHCVTRGMEAVPHGGSGQRRRV